MEFIASLIFVWMNVYRILAVYPSATPTLMWIWITCESLKCRGWEWGLDSASLMSWSVGNEGEVLGTDGLLECPRMLHTLGGWQAACVFQWHDPTARRHYPTHSICLQIWRHELFLIGSCLQFLVPPLTVQVWFLCTEKPSNIWELGQKGVSQFHQK